MGVAVLLQWRRVDARLFAWAWLAAALLSSAIALLQYFGLAAGLAPWVSDSELGLAYGNLRQRNHFASLTSIGLVCLLALVAWRTAPGNGNENRNGPDAPGARPCIVWPAAWVVMAALVLALGNAASTSRTGFLQWLLILIVLLATWALQFMGHRGRLGRVMAPSPVLWVMLWSTFCYLACVMALPRGLLIWRQIDIGTLAQRLTVSGQDSRRVLWDNVLHLIGLKPWLGWGWGELDYAHFITLYPGGRFPGLLDNAHNLPLHLAVELGLPFTVVACLALVTLVARARPWREREPGRQLAWGVLAIIGIHSLLEYPLWYGPFQWATLLCVLWLWRTRIAAGSAVAPAHSLAGPLKLMAGLCWSALAVLALDYARVSQLYLPDTARWSTFQAQPLAKLAPARNSWFFQSQIDFARLTTTRLSSQNAGEMHELALGVLHYSPEPRVVEPLIASAILLGRNEIAAYYLARYRAAFPDLWIPLLERNPHWRLLSPS